MQNIVSVILTNFFKYSILILLSFTWLSDLIDNVYIRITISVIISVSLDMIYRLITKKKRNKEKLNNKQKKEIEKLGRCLLFSKQDFILNYLKSALEKKHTTTIKSDYIIITKDNSKTIIIPSLDTLILKNDTIINAYNICKNENINKVIILSQSTNEENQILANMISDVKITLYNITDLYKKVIEKCDIKPKFEIELTECKKTNFNDITKHAFNKKLAKNYILSGILLLFASFFTKYKLYYTIISSVLLIFALICIFKNDTKTINENDDFCL